VLVIDLQIYLKMKIFSLRLNFISKNFYLFLLLLVEINGKSVKLSEDGNESSEKKKSEEDNNDDFGKVCLSFIFYDSVSYKENSLIFCRVLVLGVNVKKKYKTQ